MSDSIRISREVDGEFITMGNAIFTVELSEELRLRHGRPHFSYQVAMPRKAKPGSRIFEVRWLNKGSADLRSKIVLGTYDAGTGVYTPSKESDWHLRPRTVFQLALPVILGECRDRNRFQDEGNALLPANRCCRCAKVLTDPSSVTTGIGPECESYRALGITSVDEVPSRKTREVASLQLAYWMSGDKVCLAALSDACMDAGLDECQAEALVKLTQATMRKFKRGKSLDEGWLAFARG